MIFIEIILLLIIFLTISVILKSNLFILTIDFYSNRVDLHGMYIWRL